MKRLENLIIRKIRSTYIKRLVFPTLYLIMLGALWLFTPVAEMINPPEVNGVEKAIEKEHAGVNYVKVTMHDLKFTGYTSSRFGATSGYYYYVMENDHCYIVLLSPQTSEHGVPTIDSVEVKAAIRNDKEYLSELYESLAKDLKWTSDGISEGMTGYYISQPDFGLVSGHIFLAFYILSGGYAALQVLFFLAYIIFPVLSPTGRELGLYGKRVELLALATEELETLPQLATEDMYITEHFFIAFTTKGVTVLPISEIVWIYKHSTLHNFLWYHFSISYTLHITANKHVYIQLPKNMKSDIDGIIDYLSEANHNILVGFDEKNRIAVQKELGINRYWASFLSFMKQRI